MRHAGWIISLAIASIILAFVVYVAFLGGEWLGR